MLPTIDFFGITIYTFGTILACSWLLFVVLLHRFSWKQGFTKPIFARIIPYTISLFFFSRFFYILSEWVEEKYVLQELFHGNILWFLKWFFITQDYHFSLFGAIFGFAIVFLFMSRSTKEDRLPYLDVIVFAGLYSALLGYFGALLGGQVYGIAWDSPISLMYDHKNSIVTARSALFPLPAVYMLAVAGILFFLTRLSQMTRLPAGYTGSFGAGLFGAMLFLFEFASGTRKDIFYDYFALGMSQIGGVILIVMAILGIWRLTEKRI
jgi:Prolipoprotein diacylglyceryl transferase